MKQQRTMMRRPNGFDARLIGGLAAASVATLFLAGCGKENFLKVNGQAVSKEDYIQTLERLSVAQPGGQTSAERAALDQIVTNKVIMAEAAKENVVPSDAAVNDSYQYQQKLFQEQMPQGKDYETVQREQGTTPDETKQSIKVQLAETALYSKKMNITDSDIHKIYDKANGQFGLPARVLLRLILVAPNSADFAHASQLLASHNDFTQVAKTINAPALKATGGLLAQYTPLTQIAPPAQQAIAKASSGDVIGPIDYKIAANQPPVKAWIKVEDRRPAYNIQYEEAAPIIRQQLVQVQIMQPQYAGIRNDIIQKKLNASFEPSSAAYTTVWNAIKKSAVDQGMGQTPATTGGSVAPPASAPAKK